MTTASVSQGVVVAADRMQEWILPWWWHHYSRTNRFPVAFIDLGMGAEMRAWCSERGSVISLETPKNFVYPRTLVDRDLVAEWEKGYGPVPWSTREQWFRKPFAMLKTPFTETVWVDLDCEVSGSLAPLFPQIHPHAGMAIAKERSYLLEEAGYNSGVIVYRKESPLLERWAEGCRSHNDRFFGDQDVLSFLIQSENIEIAELSDRYNWRMKFGVNFEAVIIHWVGLWGKEIIRRAMQLSSQTIFE
jgi:hypothetical protein